MRLHAAWAVAAAILILDDTSYSAKVLTQKVMESGLSGLGRLGGETPVRTLVAQMSKAHHGQDLFEPDYMRKGVYGIADVDAASKLPEVIAAIADLRRQRLESGSPILSR
jgi:hypothetical protein